MIGGQYVMSTTPIATLTGLTYPNAMTCDPTTGYIYVANSTSSTVSEFAPGTTNATPTATISNFSTGLYDPDALAPDSSGNLYVANYRGNSVSEFAPGDPSAPTTSSG